ncbi:MAG: 2,3-diphosphoglycerate-dependent phosphoglycerate mutase [Candidatus Micrarchaeota archaeon]
MAYLTMIRHGQSQWNLENRFTGWVDIPLSPEGEEEAHECAHLLKRFGAEYDVAYTSALVRAQDTLKIIMEDNGWKMPVHKDKALNERMYGDLQGMDKDGMRKKYGAEQVRLWRRSYDVAPPGGESLKDTAARAVPYFKKRIMRDLKAGRNVLVSAHGNSLRAIVMEMEGLTPKEVVALEIPTGVPYVYEFAGKKIVAKVVLEESK